MPILMVSRNRMRRGISLLMYTTPHALRLFTLEMLTAPGDQELVDRLERSEEDGRKILYDLDSERNERRRLQQLVDQLRDSLDAITVGVWLQFEII